MRKQTSTRKVYILGAGCSKPSGYPLGDGFENALQDCESRLPSDSPKISRSVIEASRLLGKFRVNTLDHLVKAIEDDLAIPDRSTLLPDREKPPFDGKAHTPLELSDWADARINDAKVATSAIFRELEGNAAHLDLPGYPQLMSEIFGEGHWRQRLNRTSCHVLTFNYDRLFEMAFLKHFQASNPPLLVHASDILNSGLIGSTCEEVQIMPDRFCLLKLHGSAGWWVRRGAGTKGVTECRRYQVDPINGEPKKRINDATFFPDSSVYPWEPLLTFPNEKERALSDDPRDFYDIHFTQKVWNHALVVLSHAEDLIVIGYSFNSIDRKYVVENLLLKATSCKQIIISNPQARSICSALAGHYPQLKNLLVAREEYFEGRG